MKFLVVGVLCTLVLATSAFDVANFVKKYCTETNDLIVCRYFMLTDAEKNDIQKTNFILSNAAKVELRGSDIGSFNENWVNKFPNCVGMLIDSCIVYLNYTVSSISKINVKLEELSIQRSEMYFNGNSAALNKLTALKTIDIKWPTYIQHPYIDDFLFQKNTNLETVEIRGKLINTVTTRSMVNLKKLVTLKIMETSIYSLGNFKDNILLKKADFSFNEIRNIPLGDFFPKNLQEASFANNRIQVVTNETFVGLTKLKTLSLSHNKIKIVSKNAFILPSLETLNLDYNNILELENQHFSSCKALEQLFLNNNPSLKIPNDLLDGLVNLRDVIVSN